MTWRKLRGLTQAQLADRAGVSRGVVRRIERADGGASVENLIRVLRALGIQDLLTEALDPLASDVGRLRSNQLLPRRVRPRKLTAMIEKPIDDRTFSSTSKAPAE